jgi:peptidoglycan-associated lipoprotein
MKTSRVWLKICVLFFVMGFLVTAGCCKKKPVDAQAGMKGEVTQEEEAARKLKEEQERLKKAALQKFISEDVHFDFDDAAIRPDAKEILQEKVQWLKDNPSEAVTIEGHCDERGTTAYNLALGERRAQSIKKFLVNAGIDASRLQTISYGKEKPLDPGHNEAAWTKNRRGHFRVN